MIHNSNIRSKIFSFLFILLIFMNLVLSDKGCKKFYVSSNSNSRESFQVCGPNSNMESICVIGHDDTTIWAIWADVEIVVHTETGVKLNVVTEKSCDKVHEKFKNQTSSWYAGLFRPRSDEQRTTLSVSPYRNNCFAISVDSYPCKAEGEVIFHKLKLFYPVAMILGMVLFYTADEVARSILFYYTAGISLGMIMAVFLLLFVVSKFIPQTPHSTTYKLREIYAKLREIGIQLPEKYKEKKRGVGYAFMFCGSSVALYFFRVIKDQIVKGEFADIKIFYAYFMLAGIISFLYCYYRGPIESARGLDIMRWSLQSVALFMVYYSIRCEKISLAFVLILFATKWISLPAIPHYILTRGWIPYRVQSYFRGPRFITAEEYEKEGIEETAKALKALREYCESPECNTWRTVSRLKSPKRFSSFMSDGMDITLEEQQEFDETSFDCMAFLTSDEDSQDELVFGEL